MRKGGKLTTVIGWKVRIPIIPRDRASKKRLREELMKDPLRSALGRCCYKDSLLDYGELEEEISKGEG